VLVYLGDLAPVFAASARALAPGGLFAFTAEALVGEGFQLGESMRFAHSAAYLEASADAAGLRRLMLKEASSRREAGADAAGLVGVFARR